MISANPLAPACNAQTENATPAGSITTDESLYVDNTGILRSNISDFQEEFIWQTNQENLFQLTFTPTYVLNVYKNGIRLRNSDYNIVLPDKIEIEVLEDNDAININYQHFIIIP